MTAIADIKEILAHRIEGDAVSSGKWIVWRCTKNEQTMRKFVDRVKDAGVSCFCRDGKFGVLRSDVESETASAAADLASEFR